MAKKIRGWNEGTLHQRPNGSWRAQISLNGKRVSFDAKIKVECQTWLRKILEQRDRGYDIEGGKISLSKYLQRWLNTSKVALRPKTAQQYEQVIRKHINPHIGDIKLMDLRLDRIEQFYAGLLEAEVGIRTVRLTHSVLHRALGKAVRYGLVMYNPSQGATLPQYKHAEMQVLDESQVSRFLVAVHGTRFEALYKLAVTTGMRQGELFGLKWTDLQWGSGILHVQRQVQQVSGQGWSLAEPKTRAGRRSIQLGESTLHSLRQHLERQKLDKAIAGARWQDNNLIFPSRIGTPMDSANLYKDYYRHLQEAGLPKIRFHDLRHTAASLMLNHGVPAIVVSKILGHAKPSTTLDIYGHLINEMQSQAVKVMDELVTPIQVELFKKAKQDVVS